MRKANWVALGSSVVLSCGLLAWFLARRGPGADLEWAVSDVEGARAARDRERAGPARAPGVPEAWKYHLSEEVAERLMPQIKRAVRRYDPWCYFTYTPGQEIRHEWSEHPDGHFEKRANSLGVLHDGELRAAQPDLRVLFTGDSHVDGVCNVSEAFPALLETELAAGGAASDVECINAAHGAYSFYHYLGTLERFLALDLTPDVFVMTVFGGNDFRDALLLWYFFRDVPYPAAAEERWSRVRKCGPKLRPAFGQALSTVEYLRLRPDQESVVLEAARELTLEVRERCESAGVRLVVVFLPSPAELPRQADFTILREAMAYQEIEEADLARHRQLRETYVAWLEDQGVPNVDLFSAFAAHDGLLYWVRDLHLNLAGHRLAAREIAPLIERVL